MTPDQVREMRSRHQAMPVWPALRQETIARFFASMAPIADDMLAAVELRKQGVSNAELNDRIDLCEFLIRPEYIKAFGAAPSWPGQMMTETAPHNFHEGIAG